MHPGWPEIALECSPRTPDMLCYVGQAAEAAAKDGALDKAKARKAHMKRLEDERKVRPGVGLG